MRIIKFIKYYFEPSDKYVRALAYKAAKRHFSTPVRTSDNPYPRIYEYDQRRAAFLRYQRSFNHSYRWRYAKDKAINVSVE
jgi:hypothetical protein